MSKDIRRIVATDCGSTTTKAILIEKSDATGEYRLVARGEAPTTVEKPFEDVTMGVINSVTELEEISETTVPSGFTPHRRKLLADGRVYRHLKQGKQESQGADAFDGADMYVSTSSAGGGLQMMVTGVVMAMSAE